MNTAFLLMAQYDRQAVMPIELVCRDYFRHLTPEKLVRKVIVSGIALPLLRLEKSQKYAKGVHLQDLARTGVEGDAATPQQKGASVAAHVVCAWVITIKWRYVISLAVMTSSPSNRRQE